MICESTLAAAPGFSSVVAGSWLLVFDRALMLRSPCPVAAAFRLSPCQRTGAGGGWPTVIALTVCDAGNKFLRSDANHFHGNIDRRGRDHRGIPDLKRGIEAAESRPHDRGAG